MASLLKAANMMSWPLPAASTPSFTISSSALCSRVSSLQLIQFPNPVFKRSGKSHYLLRRKSRGSESGLNLFRGKASEDLADPARIVDRNLLADPLHIDSRSELRSLDHVNECGTRRHVEIDDHRRDLCDELRIRVGV